MMAMTNHDKAEIAGAIGALALNDRNSRRDELAISPGSLETTS